MDTAATDTIGVDGDVYALNGVRDVVGEFGELAVTGVMGGAFGVVKDVEHGVQLVVGRDSLF